MCGAPDQDTLPALEVSAAEAVVHGHVVRAGTGLPGAYVLDESRRVDRVGLLIIAGVFGVLSVIAGRAIHQKRALSWWLLPGGLAPTLIGAYLLFWR